MDGNKQALTPMHVLLVEDSPGDVRLTLEAFRDADPDLRLHIATDGAEAKAFLRHEVFTPTRPAPRLSCST
jgi:chemotaxis family two-component system response regulator Rcp1